MGLIIEQIEYYLPEKIVTNEDLSLVNPEWDIKKSEEKTGVLSRHITKSDQTALDLAINAIEKLFIKDRNIQDKIGGIVFCTQSQDYIMPPNSFLIHKHFGFDENVWTFDYNQACSGYIYGLAISRGILETKLANCVLLITSETYSKYMNPKDRSTITLFGDGAAASILSLNSTRGIIDVVLSSNGNKYDTFLIPAGGCRMPKSKHTKETVIDDSGNLKSPENIHMNGFAIWQFISSKVSEQIRELLNRNGLTVNDIDLFIFHQASKLTLNSLIKMLKIDENKAFMNLKYIGNTVSSSIPIALKDAEEQGKLKKNKLVLLSGFGVGLSWGSAIMKY